MTPASGRKNLLEKKIDLSNLSGCLTATRSLEPCRVIYLEDHSSY